MKKITKYCAVLILVGTVLNSCVITRPTITQLITDPALFMVAHPLSYSTNNGDYEIVVPTGFITDLASIPRLFWWWESPHEGTLAPAIIHDFLYWQQTCTKDEADAVMYLAMEEVGLNRFTANAVHFGVSTPLGHRAWNKNKSARASGESRFFTKEHAYYIMNSTIELGTTLGNLQQEAVAMNSMYFPKISDTNLKAACEAALQEYNNKRSRA